MDEIDKLMEEKAEFDRKCAEIKSTPPKEVVATCKGVIYNEKVFNNPKLKLSCLEVIESNVRSEIEAIVGAMINKKGQAE